MRYGGCRSCSETFQKFATLVILEHVVNGNAVFLHAESHISQSVITLSRVIPARIVPVSGRVTLVSEHEEHIHHAAFFHITGYHLYFSNLECCPFRTELFRRRSAHKNRKSEE